MSTEGYVEDIINLLTTNKVIIPNKNSKRLREDLDVLVKHIASDSKLEAIMHSNRNRHIEFKEQNHGRRK